MSKFTTIEGRLRDLEHSGGYVTLPDGSRFKPGNAIVLYVDFMKLRHDRDRDPTLSDFPAETQEQWRCFALWEPDAEAYGGIAVAVVELARELVGLSR